MNDPQQNEPYLHKCGYWQGTVWRDAARLSRGDEGNADLIRKNAEIEQREADIESLRKRECERIMHL